MATATATLNERGDRIIVRTMANNAEFDRILLACKSVLGARFHGEDKYWHYPLSVDTCRALRIAFGQALRVGNDLADWYRRADREGARNAELAGATDATLARVPAAFASWLRGYQRAGAAWVARGYRGAGLVADTPGLGKTTEVLAGLVEADIKGPVLIVCPKASVREVWGKEIKQHLPHVPVYLCCGTRQKREKELARFANDMDHRDAAVRAQLRIVVVVAEMLRVELGDPCYTRGQDDEGNDVPKNKISGMCKLRRKSLDGSCHAHIQVPADKEKDLVPVDFSFPALFDQYVTGGGWAAVILDESHKLLGSLNVVRGNLMGRGLKLLPLREGHRRYAMSGTPFGKGGKVQGMFGTLHWLWPDEHTSFWRWAEQVFVIEEKVINRQGKTVKELTRLKGVQANATAAQEIAAWEGFMRSLGPRILRRTKDEVLPDLPPKTILEVPCEMTAGQRRQYKRLLEFTEIKTDNGMIMPNGLLAVLTRSRQLANGVISKGDTEKVFFTGESGKIDQLWQALEERGVLDGQPGGKLIIASEFNEFLDVIRNKLRSEGVGYFRIDGRTSETLRGKQMAEWQSDTSPLGVRVMLLNTKAGGLSITLDAADEMHIMDEDTDPGVNEQLEDRIHRASRMHQTTFYYYRTEGTVDYKRAHDVEFRRRVQHSVLDGRRGVEDLRALMAEALEGNEDD